MTDDATSPTKCALCRGSTDDGLRFCSGCATRAGESILRQSTLDSTLAAANIAVDYLGHLYQGKSGDIDLDLVMLAVTAAGELRTARREICRLGQEVADLRTSRNETSDLADLVQKTLRATTRTDAISVRADGSSKAVAFALGGESLVCCRHSEGRYNISFKDQLPLKILSATASLASPWSDETVQSPIRWCSLSHEHYCGDPETQCSYVWTLEASPAWKIMVSSLDETVLQVTLFHTPNLEGISLESSQAELEEAKKKQDVWICPRDASFLLTVVSR